MRTLGLAATGAVAIAIAASGVGHAAATTGDMQAVASAAEAMANNFWKANYPPLFGGTYTPPKVIGPGNGGNTVCGNIGSNDAAYCDGDDTIVLGSQFMSHASTDGDIWIYDVVAHETGHAIQQRAKLAYSELGAECLSGATIGASAKTTPAVADGWDSIVAVENTVGESKVARSPGDHGTAQQQLNAFRLGWSQGPKACTDPSALYNITPPTKPTTDPASTPPQTTTPPVTPPVTPPETQPVTQPATQPPADPTPDDQTPPAPQPVQQPPVQQAQQPAVDTAGESNPLLSAITSLS